jgi:predicted nucleotide-binding protein (sugar kinase/HSP70/actin superfamily)
MVTIGIPRALLYYEYFPAWKTFFETLGAEVRVSSVTTRAMLEAGSGRVIADTCLPVKVFLGHVLSLKEECDYIFIPAIRSIQRKVYNCSKFLGLPDITAAVIPESPAILETEIDINKGKSALYRSVYEIGKHITGNPLKIREAGIAAWQTYLSYRGLMENAKLTCPEAIDVIAGEGLSDGERHSNNRCIALVGHPYLLYDDYINHRLIARLEQAGYRVLTPGMLSAREQEASVKKLSGSAYWTYEGEVVGAGGYFLRSEADGVIGIMAFGCGPDSLMMDTVRRQAARSGSAPFMCLTVDEHTAEAGIITRLEAFIDMTKRRKRTETCV